MMTLYYSPNSPFARKVRMAAIEKGVMAQIDAVICSPMDNTPELHAANPLGKIPALALGGGDTIFDSPVICEYLDGLSSENMLFPSDRDARMETLKAQALADGIMDACVSRFLELARPEHERSPRWIGRWEDAIKRALSVLENGQAPLPKSFDIGGISMLCALDYICLRYDTSWKTTHPKVAGWIEKFSSHESAISTMPKA